MTAAIADISLSISENELDTMLRILIDNITEVPWPFKPTLKPVEPPPPAPAPAAAAADPADPSAAIILTICL